MFISFSKTIARVGGVRVGVGVGKRVSFGGGIASLICTACAIGAKFMLYTIVAAAWVMYAVCYGIWWCCKKAFQGIVTIIRKKRAVSADNIYAQIPNDNSVHQAPTTTIKFCPHCGNAVNSGDTFCSKCGHRVR